MEIENLLKRSKEFETGPGILNPYYCLIPKDFNENIEFRRSLIEMCSESDSMAEDVWLMCRRDILFFINAFCWTYDPRLARKRSGSEIPFITYAFQDRVLLELKSVIGTESRLVNKSREQGASWMFLCLFFHEWMFEPRTALGIVSRSKEYVDFKNSKKTLFGKLIFLLNLLPDFLKPRYDKTMFYLENLANKSYIEGEATTDNIFTGNRLFSVLVDEFAKFDQTMAYNVMASLTSVTNSVFWNSTNTGYGNAYAVLAHDQYTKRIDAFWYEHPLKNPGLYQIKRDGTIEILDKEYPFPENYAFIKEKPFNPYMLRSVWYDHEWKKQPIKKIIAQEIDGDFGASGGQYFPQDMLLEYEEKYVRPPVSRGVLDYDIKDSPVPLGFTEKEDGNLYLWINLDILNRPPLNNQYLVSCDISMGSGNSNSVAKVYDQETRELVCEYIECNIMPHDFAQYVIALCRWFNTAFLAWEAQGPGLIFGQTVINLDYRHLYYQQMSGSVRHGRVSTTKPGYYPAANKKKYLIDNYISMMSDGKIICRSEFSIAECRQFIFDNQGNPVHQASKDVVDMSSARENHGDTVIADAIAALIFAEEAIPELEDSTPVALPGSLAWLREQKKKDLFENDEVWAA